MLKSTTTIGMGYLLGRSSYNYSSADGSSAKMPLVTTVTSATSTAADCYAADAQTVECSMSYIESMSQEELKEFEQLIIEKEASFNAEEQEKNTESVKVYAKVK